MCWHCFFLLLNNQHKPFLSCLDFEDLAQFVDHELHVVGVGVDLELAVLHFEEV